MDSSPPKTLVRQKIIKALGTVTPDDLRSASEALAAYLGPWALARDFEVVLGTLPLAGEPDLTSFLAGWAASGRQVALARTGTARSLDFRYVPNLEGPWDRRPYGLREPPATAPVWTPGPRTLVLVPGLGFARAPDGGFHRLGRGAGYYDRWLAVHGPSVLTLGIALGVQVIESLPVDGHDQKIDALLTPRGFIG